MTLLFKFFILIPLFCISLVGISSSYADDAIEEIIVSSDFREAQLKTISASISVINSDVINQRNSRHLEDLLALAPNVNFAAGASRGKYFQIRGIGERGQFVAPLNPSVGTYVDGIDFTGFGGAATILDIEQVEVLRGSQGTRFGANALAGVINLTSNDPSSENTGYIKTQVGSHRSIALESAMGGALTDSVLYRAAIAQTTSDGFIENITLDKKDTNNIDELTSRIKLRWLASENLTVDITALHLDIDNGYDAFSLDANRKTMSDEPGHDRQKTNAFALNTDWALSEALNMTSIVTTNRSNIEYGYDEDWSYDEFWSSNWDGENDEKYTNGEAVREYQGFDNYNRDIAKDSFEIRILSGPDGRILDSDWLLGIYYQDSSLRLDKNYYGIYRGFEKYAGPEVEPNPFTYDTPKGQGLFDSVYANSSISVFANVETPIKDNLVLTSGLRYENWKSDYSDSKQISGKNDENLMGGKLALELTTNQDNLLYLSLTRGYKAGGFNSEDDLPDESDRHFDTEYQWNYEIGGKVYSPNDDLINHITVFYTDRNDLQLDSSTPVIENGQPVDYVEYTTNAGKGYSYGIEWEMYWQANQNLNITANLGLLKTKITEYANPNSDAFDLQGRAAAHAPEYSFSTSAEYVFNEKLSATLDIQGKDKFYYSDSHNYQSRAYTLINARFAYASQNYEISAFINNVANKDYGVRGFNFGSWDQDPRSDDGHNEVEFQQLGAPRVIGISARANF